jgi:hypothetical protein
MFSSHTDNFTTAETAIQFSLRLSTQLSRKIRSLSILMRKVYNISQKQKTRCRVSAILLTENAGTVSQRGKRRLSWM